MKSIHEPNGVLNTGVVTLKPAGYDRHGPLYATKDVTDIILQEVINGNTYFMRMRRNVNTQIKEAVNSVEDETKMFTNALGNLQRQQDLLVEATKKASGSVRKSANELADGLLKVEKAADFNKLEKYVELLERAATAFESLAELEKSGKLEKIASAIK